MRVEPDLAIASSTGVVLGASSVIVARRTFATLRAGVSENLGLNIAATRSVKGSG